MTDWDKPKIYLRHPNTITYPYGELLDTFFSISNINNKNNFCREFREAYINQQSTPNKFKDWCNFNSSKIYSLLEKYNIDDRKEYQNKFIDFGIQHYIEKNNTIIYKTSCIINHIAIQLSIKWFKRGEAILNSSMLAFTQRIKTIIFRMVSMSGWTGNITIELWLTPFKKMFPHKRSPFSTPPCLGSPHVNSGLASMRHNPDQKYLDCKITIFSIT